MMPARFCTNESWPLCRNYLGRQTISDKKSQNIENISLRIRYRKYHYIVHYSFGVWGYSPVAPKKPSYRFDGRKYVFSHGNCHVVYCKKAGNTQGFHRFYYNGQHISRHCYDCFCSKAEPYLPGCRVHRVDGSLTLTHVPLGSKQIFKIFIAKLKY